MKITVIVPAYNATTLPECLKALREQAGTDTEIIVVDDCSTDQTREIAANSGATVLWTSQQSGPAAARNIGAEAASGEILFFVDADVVIGPGTMERVQHDFAESPGLAAVFGSYDDSPAEPNFLSQYKNLLHHFVHQISNENAGTFWAGCGAIRKEAFFTVNGFDAKQYPYPSIEDIELGIRLREKGYSILLDKQLHGKHLKRWTPLSLLKADILRRAVPWSKLIAESGVVPNDLNLQTSQRLSAVLSALIFGTPLLMLFIPPLLSLATAVFLLVLLMILNWNLYSFLLRRKGPLFLIGSMFWHMLYYIYSGITFVLCWFRFRPRKTAKKPASVIK